MHQRNIFSFYSTILTTTLSLAVLGAVLFKNWTEGFRTVDLYGAAIIGSVGSILLNSSCLLKADLLDGEPSDIAKVNPFCKQLFEAAENLALSGVCRRRAGGEC